MAGLLGKSSNHFDELFKELETWEAILSELPDFDVVETSPLIDPPDLSPR